MSELRQPQFYDETSQDKEQSIPVLVGPNLEAHNFSSMEELESSISGEDIERALGLAGAWSDLQPIRKVPKHALSGCISLSNDFPDRLLGISEDELFKKLDKE